MNQSNDKEITEHLLQVEKESFFDMDLVEAISKEAPERTSEEREKVERLRREHGGNLYPKLIWTITQKAYDPSRARRLWEDILSHRKCLQSKLGRDAGIAVAALDYMLNIRHEIEAPKVLEESDMEKMAETALVDELTGLYLRGVFDVLLEKNIREGIRYDRSLSLIMADIDDFKDVNDKYGHGKGDEVLKRIGDIFLKNVRDADVPARYGGEEIAVILPETPEASARNLAERLRVLVENEFKKDISLTISLGVATSPQHACSPDGLTKAADEALYRAKAKGKNLVVAASRQDR
ncbi:MAG: GGDEF domain-containing protein [Thermodesulfobacteriota bacterium]|nr:GGDEF domain-containing protein [Thermodesulfobacteriota bacterium]